MKKFDMSGIDNVFYTVIGPHAGKKPEQILADKQKEIVDCGFSLWGVSIDNASIDNVWKLGKEARIVVFGKFGGEDPQSNCNTARANRMITPEGKFVVPQKINSEFAVECEYQAYKIKEINILNEPVVCDFGKFEAYTAKYKVWETFAERFKQIQFQNVYGRRNDELAELCLKENINVIFELEYPFVVRVTNCEADRKSD